VVSLKFIEEQKQILRLTTPKLKNAWGPVRSDGFVGQGADLRHLCHQPRDGAIGHSLDAAEGLI
jgi:hypothetical protein